MQLLNELKHNWSLSRILKGLVGISALISYFISHDDVYLLIGSVLSAQAIFNITCPGGACSTNNKHTDKPLVKIKKYEPNKK